MFGPQGLWGGRARGKEGRRPPRNWQMSRQLGTAQPATAAGGAGALKVGADAALAGAIKPGFRIGRDAVEYNECPPFEENLVSASFVAEMVGKFDNDEPERSFADPSWSVFGKSPPDAKDKIKYMMAKRKREGFPIMEILGYAEFEGISAAVRAPRCVRCMQALFACAGGRGGACTHRTVQSIRGVHTGCSSNNNSNSCGKSACACRARPCGHCARMLDDFSLPRPAGRRWRTTRSARSGTATWRSSTQWSCAAPRRPKG